MYYKPQIAPVTRLALSMSAAIVSCALPFSAGAQTVLPGGVAGDCVFYEHIDLNGAYFQRNAGTDVSFVGSDWNDEMSSVWVRRGVRVDFYDHRAFDGDSWWLSGDGPTDPAEVAFKLGDGFWYNLTEIGYNDTISSFTCN
jgi:hypothetical protein